MKSMKVLAVVLVGTWVGDIDPVQVEAVLSGRAPFDERTMLDDEPQAIAGQPDEVVASA